MDKASEAKMKAIQENIRLVRQTPGADNKPVLAVNLEMLQRAKNGGFPKAMHHATLPPMFAYNEEEETIYSQNGYGPYYIPQPYPRIMYRRNMDRKFQNEAFVETIRVEDEHTWLKLSKTRAMGQCGPWGTYDSLDALPDPGGEDPGVAIARLEGQLAEARRELESPKLKRAPA